MRVSPATTLLVDADDTLWETASQFEGARDRWLGLMQEHGVQPRLAREHYERHQAWAFRLSRYGSPQLAVNLKACVRELAAGPQRPALYAACDVIARDLMASPIEPYPEVHDALENLAQRHQLILVTMGDSTEQLGKFERSGLKGYFDASYVLGDKTRSHYRQLLRSRGLNRDTTWMVGNSQTKDIRPAQAAGLKTVWVAQGGDFDFGAHTSHGQATLELHNLAELPGALEAFGAQR